MTSGMRGLGMAAGVVVLALAAASCSRPGTTTTVTVPLDRPWTQAGVLVRSGSTVSIEAGGTNQAGPGISFGPEGLQSPAGWTRATVVQGEPPLGLIARIGDEGAPFYVGRSFAGRVWEGGPLYLGVNDVAPNQNAGAWTVTVTIR